MTKKLKHTIPPGLKVFPVCVACSHLIPRMSRDICEKHNVEVLSWYGCADYVPYQTELTVCTTARAKSVMPIAPVTE